MANETLEVGLTLDTTSVKKGFDEVSRKSKKTGDKIGNNLSDGLNRARRSLLTLGGSFAAFVGVRKLYSDLKDFNRSFAEITTITKLNAEQQKNLNKQLLETAKQFGTDAQSQAKSFYQIISAGVTDASRATMLLTEANKLAIGGLTTTEGAIDLLTSTVNAFGQESLSASRAADIIFGTVKLGKTRVEELQASLGMILPSAKAIGVSFEETSAAIAQLTTKGLSTSIAVTQLNAVFTAVLKKQDEARKLGPKVAEAFKLQALQTKGLTKFLKDLNIALGGSQEKLFKLMGRVEGSKAITSLASDGFVGLGEKVQELANSAGASDEAYKKMAKTIDKKVKVLLSTLSVSLLEISQISSGVLITAIEGLTNIVQYLFENFQRVTRQAIIFLALWKGGAVLKTIGTGFTSMIAKVSEFRLAMKLATESGARGFKKLKVAIQLTNVSLKGLRVGVKLLKAGLTLGLSLAIDWVIEKLITLSDEVGGIGNLFSFLGLKIKQSFLTVVRDIIGEIIMLSPQIAEKFGITVNTFESFSRKLETVKSQLAEIEQKKKNIESSGGLTGKPNDPTAGTGGGDEPVVNESDYLLTFDNIMSKMDEVAKEFKIKAKDIASSLHQGLGTGVGNAFAAFGKAIAKGENALNAFLNTLVASMGQMAVQLGTQFILQGIAYSWAGMPNGPSLIAAGAALATFGGILSAVGGGGATATGADTSTTEAAATTQDFQDEDIDAIQERGQQVTVNVEGAVLDPQGTGLKIAEILNEAGFGSGAVLA